MTDVRRATRKDVADLSRALSLAFADDPVMEWLYGTEPAPQAKLERMFATMLRAWYLRHDETWTTTDGIAGAAIWTPPGHWRPGVLDQLRTAPTMLRLIGRRMSLIGRGMRTIEKHHLREPHYYLAVLGTDPSKQGKGFGSAMLQPVLQRCDDEGALAYLESSKEQNIPFYQRHGFVVQPELRLPEGPLLWPMLREPAR